MEGASENPNLVHEDSKLSIQERNTLHEWIKNDELEKVKEFTTKNRSEYYLNDKNHSAAFTALKNKKFKIYAYLQSINVNLMDCESKEMDKLSAMEKHELRDVMLSFFSTSEKSHIYFLVSKMKIKSESAFKQYEEGLFGYLEELNQVPSVSIILKVIQYAENLDLVLDLQNENVKTVCPSSSSKTERGTTFHLLNTIYVAAGKRKRTEVLGTIAHELTHMAMQLVFKNDCDPYFIEDDNGRKEFEELAEFLEENVRRVPGTPSETITDAFLNYDENLVPSELIARVPHILAQYTEGEEWLSKNAPKLLNFFNQKVVLECEKFIEEHHLSKQKSLTRYMNESEGEILNLKKSDLFFGKIGNIQNFLNSPDKKIFALITEYTWLGLFRALQATYGANYAQAYDQFLVFKLENVVKNLGDVEYVFNSEATKVLFVECPENIDDDPRSLRAVERMIQTAGAKEDKKIIFIINQENNANFINIVEGLGIKDSLANEIDEDFSVCDLDDNSRGKILDLPILFQGKAIVLGDLVQNDEDLLKCISAEMTQNLLDNKTIEVGSKPFDTSNLEGAYVDVVSPVNLDTLFYEMKNGNDIFVINGENIPNRIMELHKSLNQEFDTSLLGKMENCKFKKISNEKKIFWTNKEVTDQDFKKFCCCNSTKKIYLLEMKEKFAFELLKVYNPEFYIKRKFNRVTFKKDLLTKKELGSLKPAFIVGKNQDCNSKINPQISYVHLFDLKNSDVEYEKRRTWGKFVHLLKYENNKLLWIKSSGPLSFDLRRWIDNDDKEIIEYETELMKRIKNEKLVILADDPGMGKSTTITKLCEFENVLDTLWVIRINLKDHIKSIREINSNIDTNQVMKLLLAVDPKLKNDFSKNLLDAALDKNKNFSKVLLLCFDGFDEILEETDRKIIIDLLKFLKNSTRSKIWITTRLHFKKALEDALQVFSITFEPIDNPSKIDFIANYMENRLKLSLTKTKFDEVFEDDNKVKENSVLLDYTKMFLDKVKSIFKKDLERFIGTPLQLHLLLENSVESFLNWIENSVKPDFLYLGKDLVEVYKNYFNAKYEVCFKKKKILEKDFQCMIREKFEKCHEELANSLFFEEPATETSKYKSSLLLLGITKSEFEKIVFVHLTFQEYFLAQYLVESFKNKHCSSCLQKLCNLFMKKILADVKYTLVRHFIDIHLSNDRIKNIFESKILYEEFVAVFKSLEPNMIFRFAIIERNNSLLDFLLSFTELDYRILLEDQWGGELLLHLATREKNNFAVERIIEVASNHNLIESCLLEKNTSRNTAICLAIGCKNDFALDLIIEKAKRFKILDKVFKNVDSLNSTAIYSAVQHNNNFALDKIIDEASKIDNLLPELLNDNAVDGTAFNLVVLYKNDEALTKIIDLARDSDLEQLKKLIMIPDRHNNTPLHSAVREKNEFAFNQIINIAPKFKLEKEILSAANDCNINLFHIAVGNKNDWALERLIEITPNEILIPLLLHAFTEYENTEEDYADEYDDLSFLQKSFKERREYHVPQELDEIFGSYNENAFHKAVRFKNDFAVDQIMELASNNNLLEQILNSVSVYRGTEFSLTFNCGYEFPLKQEQSYIWRCEDTPFSLAIKSKNEYAVTKMMELAANYNLNQHLLNIVNNNTAFHLAIKYDNFFAMNKISSMLDVNQQYRLLSVADKDGKSVLELAAFAKDQRFIDLVTEMLLTFSGDKIFELLSIVNQNNEAILHLVLYRKQFYAFSRIIEILSKLSVDQQYEILTSCNKFRRTIFHLTVSLKNENVVNQIFEVRNKFSAEQQRQFLEMKDINGKTVLDLANDRKNEFVINQISEIKAKLGTN